MISFYWWNQSDWCSLWFGQASGQEGPMDCIQQLSSLTKHSSALLLRSHIQMRPRLSLCFKTFVLCRRVKTVNWGTVFILQEMPLQHLDFMQAVCQRQKPWAAHARTCWLIKTLLREHKIWLWGKDQNCSVGGTRVEDTGVRIGDPRRWGYTGDVVSHPTSRTHHSEQLPGRTPKHLDPQRVREPTTSNYWVKGWRTSGRATLQQWVEVGRDLDSVYKECNMALVCF